MESKPTKQNGVIKWQLPDGTIHREDGPAIIRYDFTEEWLFNGIHHRLDGPAIFAKHQRYDWYINGRNVTLKILKWAEEMNIDLDNLSTQDKQLIALFWGNYGE